MKWLWITFAISLWVHLMGAIVDGYGSREKWTNRTVWKLLNWARRDCLIVAAYCYHFVATIYPMIMNLGLMVVIFCYLVTIGSMAMVHYTVFRSGYEFGIKMREIPASEKIMPKWFEYGYRVALPAIIGAVLGLIEIL